MFVLGIDPGLAATGYAVVEDSAGTSKAVGIGILRTDPAAPLPLRLTELHGDLEALIAEYRPDEAAVEEVFTNRNLRTATAVGRASGVVLLTLAQAGLPVFEYTPSAVKAAVTGYGNAPKEQVQRMVERRLGLTEPASPDAADALAVALCHVQRTPVRQAVERAR